MKLLKKLARKILEKDIERDKKELKDLREEHSELTIKYNDTYSTMRDYNQKLLNITKENTDLQKELNILKEYYHLDREPTDEEMTKIRINLKIHDLERENMNLQLNQIIKNQSNSHLPYIYLNHYPYGGLY